MNNICGYSLDEQKGKIKLCTCRAGHKDNYNSKEEYWNCSHEEEKKTNAKKIFLQEIREKFYKNPDKFHNEKQEAFQNIHARFRKEDLKDALCIYIMSTKRIDWSFQRRKNYVISLTDHDSAFYHDEEFISRVESLFEGFMKHEQKQHGDFAFCLK